jgi:hypothetical protein
MTEQSASGMLAGTAGGAVGQAPETIGPALEESPLGHAAAVAHESFHGRPVSWVAVAIITVGFVVGGFSMVPTPTWWLFWTAAAITAVGLGVGALARMSEDWY